MVRFPVLAVTLLASACSDAAPTSDPAEVAGPTAPAVARAPTTEPPPVRAAAGRIEETSDLLEFTYAWPAEASAVPLIVGRFREEARTAQAEAIETAREDKAARAPDAPTFNGHHYSKDWETTGQTPRLLSLAALFSTFTGGAHPNSGFDTLIWDRAADREVAFADLFADAAAAFRLLEPAYCAELDKQRAEKRQETLPLKKEPDDWMTACPKLAQAPVALIDADRDGRFEAIRVLLGPYEAGPYAEGAYEIDIILGDEVRAAAKEQYRGSFAS